MQQAAKKYIQPYNEINAKSVGNTLTKANVRAHEMHRINVVPMLRI